MARQQPETSLWPQTTGWMFCDAEGNPTGSNKGMETIWTHSVMSFESTQRFKQHEIRLKPNVPDMNDMDRCDVISNVKISNTKPEFFYVDHPPLRRDLVDVSQTSLQCREVGKLRYQIPEIRTHRQSDGSVHCRQGKKFGPGDHPKET